jgi:glutamate formiminotransferase
VTDPLVECVPNFSEGRDATVIRAIADAIAAVPGAHVLDVSSDVSHHRTVITCVAPRSVIVEAVFAGVREAAARIDLTRHAGVHPRLGAADVVPFVPLDLTALAGTPLGASTMDDCVRLAEALAERVARALDLPAYLYEFAARTPARGNLADVRRGGFEGLRDTIAIDPARAPDVGPRIVHPTAGAVAIGARRPLVAWNVYLGGAEWLPVAREVARAVRASSGGLPAVKALALVANGQAQVSMNLVDIDETPLARAMAQVCAESRARGVEPVASELIGLLPERCLEGTTPEALLLHDFTPRVLLEPRVRVLGTAAFLSADDQPRVISPAAP